MNKTWIGIATLLLVSSAFAGCSKKEDGHEGEHLDESAVYDSGLADTGFRVAGSLTAAGTALPTGSNSSAASVEVVDSAMDDLGGAADKADFLLDAKDADGTRVQAVLKSMATGEDVGVGQDLQGGVANNVPVFGSTGLGPSEFPEAKAYIALFGLSRVKIGDKTVERSQFTQVFVTQGIRGADGALASKADEHDQELHVLIGATSADGPQKIPDVPDGFLYYYFENVRLKQLAPEDKGSIGSKLSPPERDNVPPVVVAQVKLANGTAVTSATLMAGGANPGNLTVTLDASNSTDPDGTIEAFSWDIRETNSTGSLIPAGNQSKPSGATVDFTFTSGGLKAIGLRIIDSDGGIANTTVYFFVDYVLQAGHDFSTAAPPGTPVGGGNSCIEPNNCNPHQFSVGYGATKIAVKAPKTVSGTCQSPTVVVYDAKGTQIGSGATVTVTDAAKLASIGKWKVTPYFQAQVNCKYTIDIEVYYAPMVAA